MSVGPTTVPGTDRPGPPAAVAGGGRAHRRRRVALGLVALVALVLATVLGGPPSTDGALDPRSTEPGGLHGLLALAEEMGGQVDIATSLPSELSTRILVPRDDLSPAQREELAAFVEEGGTAVVADPSSSLHELEAGAAPIADVVGAQSRAPECGSALPGEVTAVTHAEWQSFTIEDADEVTPCFPVAAGQAWLVLQPRGAGHLVSLGSAGPLVNAALDRDDNPVLAAALLFPAPGDSLQVLEGEPTDTDTALGDLVPPRVWQGLGLLLLAAVVGVLAVARRLGRPVQERLPPAVPTAGLTRSIGNLWQRAGRRDAAATRLRRRAREELGRWVGPDLPPEALVERAVARLHVDHDDAARALLDRPVPDDEELVAVAAAVNRLHDRLRAPS